MPIRDRVNNIGQEIPYFPVEAGSAQAMTAANAAGEAPTAAEFNALVLDVSRLRTRYNSLVNAFDEAGVVVLDP